MGLFFKARHLTVMLPLKKDSTIYPSSGSARTIDYLPQGTPEELELGGHADLEGNINRNDHARSTLFERQEQIHTNADGAISTSSQLVESIDSVTDRDHRHVGEEEEEVQEITPLSFLVAVSVHAIYVSFAAL